MTAARTAEDDMTMMATAGERCWRWRRRRKWRRQRRWRYFSVSIAGGAPPRSEPSVPIHSEPCALRQPSQQRLEVRARQRRQGQARRRRLRRSGSLEGDAHATRKFHAVPPCNSERDPSFARESVPQILTRCTTARRARGNSQLCPSDGVHAKRHHAVVEERRCCIHANGDRRAAESGEIPDDARSASAHLRRGPFAPLAPFNRIPKRSPEAQSDATFPCRDDGRAAIGDAVPGETRAAAARAHHPPRRSELRQEEKASASGKGGESVCLLGVTLLSARARSQEQCSLRCELRKRRTCRMVRRGWQQACIAAASGQDACHLACVRTAAR